MKADIKWNPHTGHFWHIQVDSNGNGQLNISEKELDELILELDRVRKELNESKKAW